MSKYNIEKLKEVAKNMLKDKRFYHSLNVADLAYKLAKAHGLDTEKAYVAGLLHDITKELDESWQDQCLKDNNDIDKLSYPYKTKHAYTAKYYVCNTLGISDEDILDAIYNHTICTSNKPLAKVVYIADKREVGRNINDSIVDMAMNDLEKGYQELNKDVKKYLESKTNEKYIG